MKSGSLNFVEPTGPLQARNGTDFWYNLYPANDLIDFISVSSLLSCRFIKVRFSHLYRSAWTIILYMSLSFLLKEVQWLKWNEQLLFRKFWQTLPKIFPKKFCIKFCTSRNVYPPVLSSEHVSCVDVSCVSTKQRASNGTGPAKNVCHDGRVCEPTWNVDCW